MELNKYLKPFGRLLGPDPSSNPSLGGMASTGFFSLSLFVIMDSFLISFFFSFFFSFCYFYSYFSLTPSFLFLNRGQWHDNFKIWNHP